MATLIPLYIICDTVQWPTKPEIFTIWLLKENVCWPLNYAFQTLMCRWLTWGSCYIANSNSGGLGWGLRFCFLLPCAPQVGQYFAEQVSRAMLPCRNTVWATNMSCEYNLKLFNCHIKFFKKWILTTHFIWPSVPKNIILETSTQCAEY